MCGIFGYIGPKNSADVCISGLKFLEYRGYDSSGIAGIQEGRLVSCKEIGKISSLAGAIEDQSLEMGLAIAHTRWATHGKPSRENAHPHFDAHRSVAVVHNGIIENHFALREMLKDKGYTFYSETDTEVVAQLVSYFYAGNFMEAVRKTLDQLKGFWALALIHKDHPDQIIATSRENPLAIGTNQAMTECFISSDVNAFSDPDLNVMFLRNNELALITTSDVKVFDSDYSPVMKFTEKLQLDQYSLSKNGFEHFMLKEIFEQPDTIRQALQGRLLEDFGTAEFDDLSITPQELSSVKRILILACGTSWHAGCIAASLLEEKARIPTQAEIASEFRYKNPIISEDTLVIAISQSGETLDTIAAVREVKAKGAKILAICNVRNSTLTREADACLFLRAGPEISVCSTKAFTSQLTVLSLFSLLMARLRHMSKEEGKEFLHELQQLPEKVEAVLKQKGALQFLAAKYAKYDHFFFLGRNYMHATSLEAALKLKEISYIHAVGYPAGEMKHGPLALVCPELAIVGLCGNKRTMDKTLSNLMEAKSRGAPLLIFASEGTKEIEELADDILWLPSSCDELSSVVFSVAAQIFAYYIATQRGTEIDQPRNLAKSVTVE
ncbi:MAG: glutamine--fructose-6-phosphate transaminase (isomerizing) [Chlamydiae bacterium]|nr:glutamine--fructose-6-phosphate transaminase (isomerizing) [Chlamydiota bacterium]